MRQLAVLDLKVGGIMSHKLGSSSRQMEECKWQAEEMKSFGYRYSMAHPTPSQSEVIWLKRNSATLHV